MDDGSLVRSDIGGAAEEGAKHDLSQLLCSGAQEEGGVHDRSQSDQVVTWTIDAFV